MFDVKIWHLVGGSCVLFNGGCFGFIILWLGERTRICTTAAANCIVRDANVVVFS